jgi:hypothetical protein
VVEGSEGGVLTDPALDQIVGLGKDKRGDDQMTYLGASFDADLMFRVSAIEDRQ